MKKFDMIMCLVGFFLEGYVRKENEKLIDKYKLPSKASDIKEMGNDWVEFKLGKKKFIQSDTGNLSEISGDKK